MICTCVWIYLYVYVSMCVRACVRACMHVHLCGCICVRLETKPLIVHVTYKPVMIASFPCAILTAHTLSPLPSFPMLRQFLSMLPLLSQVEVGLSLGTPFTCFHHHLMYMMEHLLPKSGEMQDRWTHNSARDISGACTLCAG